MRGPTPTTARRLEELREIAYGPPCLETWGRLCAALERWPRGEEGERVALEYVSQAVSGWEDGLRAAPEEWQRALYESRASPRWWPLCRSLSLTARRWELVLARALELGLLRSLRSLDLSGRDLSKRRWGGLWEGDALSGLVNLEVESCGLGEREARGLASAPLPVLRRLRLGQNPFSQASTWEALSGARWPVLEELSVAGLASSDAMFRALSGAGWAPGLRVLDLSHVSLPAERAALLVSAGAWGRLERLRLPACRTTAPAVEALASGLPALRSLEVNFSALGEEGARALCAGRWRGSMEALHLWACGLDGAALGALFARAWPALRTLELSGNALGGRALEALTASPRALWLARCGLTAEALSALPWGANGVECRYCLTDLYLDNNPIGDEGLQVLAGAAWCEGLEVLHIDGCGVTDRGVEALLEAPWLGGLRRLSIRESALSAASVEALRARIGEVWAS